MAFDQDIGFRIFYKTIRHFLKIPPGFLAQNAGVDLKEQPRVKSHINSFSDPRSLGIGHRLLDFFSLFVHMMSDQVSCSAAYSRAYKGTPYRTFTDESARTGSCRGSDGCPFLRFIQAFAAG